MERPLLRVTILELKLNQCRIKKHLNIMVARFGGHFLFQEIECLCDNSVPVELQEEDHGFTAQIVSSFLINEKAFIQITPIYEVKAIDDTREDEFILEIEPVIDIMGSKYQCGVFYRGEFESRVNIFSVYFTVFL